MTLQWLLEKGLLLAVVAAIFKLGGLRVTIDNLSAVLKDIAGRVNEVEKKQERHSAEIEALKEKE